MLVRSVPMCASSHAARFALQRVRDAPRSATTPSSRAQQHPAADMLRRSLWRAVAVVAAPSPYSSASSGVAALVSASRAISSYGRVTDEDRRWWLVHLECAPDVTPGTFVSWLDNCGTHTQKKLIERNIWTIEQVAALSSDQVDELRYKEGCVHMDVVWEHARTVLVPLQARGAGMSAEQSSLQARVLELRKKRELERRREEILQERSETVESREATLRQLREQIERKREALRQRQQQQQQQQSSRQQRAEEYASGGDASGGDGAPEARDVERVVDELGGDGGRSAPPPRQ
jgi:hypothetical protein